MIIDKKFLDNIEKNLFEVKDQIIGASKDTSTELSLELPDSRNPDFDSRFIDFDITDQVEVSCCDFSTLKTYKRTIKDKEFKRKLKNLEYKILHLKLDLEYLEVDPRVDPLYRFDPNRELWDNPQGEFANQVLDMAGDELPDDLHVHLTSHNE